MIKIKNRILFNIILCFSIFAIFFAYFVQYILGHQPCNLCLIERIPYILTIIIIICSLVIKSYEKIYLALLSFIFISSTLISFYHLGIEQGFIKESLVCDLGSQNSILTAENILKELEKKTISCENVTFKILGFSLATINTIISLILSVILTKTFFKYEKK